MRRPISVQTAKRFLTVHIRSNGCHHFLMVYNLLPRLQTLTLLLFPQTRQPASASTSCRARSHLPRPSPSLQITRRQPPHLPPTDPASGTLLSPFPPSSSLLSPSCLRSAARPAWCSRARPWDGAGPATVRRGQSWRRGGACMRERSSRRRVQAECRTCVAAVLLPSLATRRYALPLLRSTAVPFLKSIHPPL